MNRINLNYLINQINYFKKLAAAPEFLKLMNENRGNSDLWFGSQIATVNNDLNNFAVLDNRIRNAISNLARNYSIVENDPEEINKFYLENNKTQELIQFICNSYNRHFPHLDAFNVLNYLENDGSLDASSGIVTNPIFILIHDLIHQVIQKDFVSELESQTGEDEELITLLDQLNEDLASSLSNFQPGSGSSQGLRAYLKYIFLRQLKSTGHQNVNQLKEAIEKTFHFAKAELRGKLEKIKEEMSESYSNKVKPISPKLKQFVDGILSRLKNEMNSQAQNVLLQINNTRRNAFLTTWDLFELDDIFDSYNQSILSSSVIDQADSSALRGWMLGCLNQMKKLLNYFENDLEQSILSEYEEEDEDEDEDNDLSS